jgi:hypothetical protein
LLDFGGQMGTGISNVSSVSRGRSSTNLIAGGATCLSGGKRENNWGKKKIAIISAYEHTKFKLTVFMLLGGPQNTIKCHLVFTTLFCFAPFSVFSSRMSAPYCTSYHSNTNVSQSCAMLLLGE